MLGHDSDIRLTAGMMYFLRSLRSSGSISDRMWSPSRVIFEMLYHWAFL
jgi:hypothetical protein